MDFDYFVETKVNAQLAVDDVGNCCIRANNDAGEEWYLIIKTLMGTTEIVEYGPVELGANANGTFKLPEDTFCSYYRTDYSVKRISKRIYNFLNNPKRDITQASECNFDEIKDNIMNIVECLQEA